MWQVPGLDANVYDPHGAGGGGIQAASRPSTHHRLFRAPGSQGEQRAVLRPIPLRHPVHPPSHRSYRCDTFLFLVFSPSLYLLFLLINELIDWCISFWDLIIWVTGTRGDVKVYLIIFRSPSFVASFGDSRDSLVGSALTQDSWNSLGMLDELEFPPLINLLVWGA